MKVRLGYACISETVEGTASSTYTFTNYKIEHNMEKLEKIIRSNLFHLKELFIYNIKNNIHFFRITSNLIPLATKKEVEFDYFTPYKKEYEELALLIKESNMRVDFHPSEYCILNSTRREVIENSIEILKYHYNLLKYLKIKDPILVLHVGSREFGKEKALSRFIHTFQKLPKEIKEVIAIENDDKSYNIEDCLYLSSKIGTPLVLDYHHHLCNPTVKSLEELLPKVIDTWKDKKYIPKMHFSSPKSKQKKEFRSHHDYIHSDDFIAFLELLKKVDSNIDIMIEAKRKDEAMFRLIRELKYKTNILFLDDTTFML